MTPIVVSLSSWHWINQRRQDFGLFQSISGPGGIFALDTHGVSTNRDAWTVNFSRAALVNNINSMFAFHKEQRTIVQALIADGLQPTVKDLVHDPKRIAWGTVMEQDALKNRPLTFDEGNVRRCIYRPFTAEWLYFHRDANHSGYRVGQSWASDHARPRALVLTAAGSHDPFSLFATDLVPNYHSLDTCMVFPAWTYQPLDTLAIEEDAEVIDGYRRASNITDETLTNYQKEFGADVTKDDIFYYVYGILHSPEYRERFEANLKKMLPRIPKVKAFRAFTVAGCKLAELHLNYESVEPYPLRETRSVGASDRVEKMRYSRSGKTVDKTTIVYDSGIKLSGIPLQAQEYMLGARSALDWIVERYRVKTDKASGIVNDPNDWAEEHNNPRYILDLIARITTVSVETVKIVASLLPLDLVEEQ